MGIFSRISGRRRKTKELREWAEIHGSELLKKQIEKGFDWKRRARVEFLDFIQPPGWEEPEYESKEIVYNPTEQEMEAFEEAERLAKNNELIRHPRIWILTGDGWAESVVKITLFTPCRATRVVVKPITQTNGAQS